MASISKRGTSYRAMVYFKDENGNDKRVTKTFKLKKDAQSWATETEYAIATGSDFISTKMLFPDFYLQWMKSTKENKIRLSSYKKYISWQNNIAVLFKNVPMEKLNTLMLQKRLDEFGETHSPEYMKNFVFSIRACLQNAQINGAVQKDLHTLLEANGNKDREVRVKNYLDATEFETMQGYLYDHESELKESGFNLMVLTALETGARVGEIQALKRSDFNFKERTMTIDKSWSYNTKEVTPPKNKASERTIKLSDRFSKMVERHFEILTGDDLFPKRYTSTSRLNKLRALTKELRVTPIRFHGLRHSHVSYLLHHDVDITYISKRVGHANINITLSTYAHLLKEKEQTQDELALSYLSKIN